MEEVFFYLGLAALIWGWPFLGAILGGVIARRRWPLGAVLGFLVGCLATLLALRIVSGPNLS